MVWCSNCLRDLPTECDDTGCMICCSGCGKVLHLDDFIEVPTFVRDSGGESRLAGTLVKSIQSDYSESYKRTLEKGNIQISDLAGKLHITDDSIKKQASSFYRIGVERSFTKGRRTAQVAAACLYIACRANKKPYLLIEFAFWLSINVYVLGAVYLQLCKLLSLEEHPFVQKPVDPSLFLHRFTSALMKGDLKGGNMKVLNTALHIVASMKRDWMQTGRKPSGICGAALYISALSHGFRFSKSDIVKVVRICEATLTKRLIEFENTESGSLTIEEFNKTAEEFEKENHSSKLSDVNSPESRTMEVLCEHKGREPHFAHGLCRSCYKDFIKLSGGLHGGSEPPAFQLAEMERLPKTSAEMSKESSFVLKPHQDKNSSENEVGCVNKAKQNVTENDQDDLTECATASTIGNLETINDAFDTFQKLKDMPTVSDETDSLSDIDDIEVNGYLNNEEESRYKKIIWEEMNKEYLQEQAAKEAAAVAAFSDVREASDDLRAAQELAAAAAAAVAESREKRRQKRALEAKNASPAQTAAEATRQMLTKKGLSSKINYDVLEKLFDDNLAPNTKRNRFESHLGSNATGQQVNEEENEEDTRTNIDEREQNDDDMEETVAKGAYSDQWNFESGEEVYDYDYDDHDGYDVY